MRMIKTMLAVAVTLLVISSTANAAPENARWLILGDSIQAQVYGPDANAVNLTASRIPTLTNVNIHNYSSPGAVMARLEPYPYPAVNWVSGIGQREGISYITGFFGAEGIVITLGGNDWGQGNISLESFATDYTEFVRFAKSMNLDVVCVGMIWSKDEEDASGNPVPNAAGEYYSDYRSAIETACNAHGGTYINAVDAVPHSTPTEVADNYAGVHPTNAGHIALSNWLVSQMQTLGFWP